MVSASRRAGNFYFINHYGEGHELEIAEIDYLPEAETRDLEENYKLTTEGDREN